MLYAVTFEATVSTISPLTHQLLEYSRIIGVYSRVIKLLYYENIQLFVVGKDGVEPSLSRTCSLYMSVCQFNHSPKKTPRTFTSYLVTHPLIVARLIGKSRHNWTRTNKLSSKN